MFLKDWASFLATQITQVCNLSISSSRSPHACKIAKLKPLFKKGFKMDPKNYRPISLLPLMSKMLEIITHEQTMDFLDKHNILYNFQLGFQKNLFYQLLTVLFNRSNMQRFWFWSSYWSGFNWPSKSIWYYRS